MPVEQVEDESGDTMTLLNVDGYYVAPFPVPNLEDEIRSIRQWKSRDDDILLAAYPKSGTNWLWEIISMLISKTNEYKPSKVTCMLESKPKDYIDNLPSPRVMNTHLHPRHLPEEYFQKKRKIVLVLRNPKDILVSNYNHHFNIVKLYNYHGTWQNYIHRFISGKLDYNGVFEYMDVWQEFIRENPDYPIMIVYYEDLIQNGIKELKKLTNFLEMDIEEDFIGTVHRLCSFDNLKSAKDAMMPAGPWRDGKPALFRKGKVGDWKNWLTVAQNEMFNKVLEENMKNSIFQFKYILD